jgi:hypothetical protein
MLVVISVEFHDINLVKSRRTLTCVSTLSLQTALVYLQL